MAKKFVTTVSVPALGSGFVGCSPCMSAGAAIVAMPIGAARDARLPPCSAPEPRPWPKSTVGYGGVPVSGRKIRTGTRYVAGGSTAAASCRTTPSASR
jgi:hypothetical protein